MCFSFELTLYLVKKKTYLECKTTNSFKYLSYFGSKADHD